MNVWVLSALRRRRRRKIGVAQRQLRSSLGRAGIYLAVIFLAHIAAMRLFENMSVPDAVWLTLTTLTTVGYGDISAVTPSGRIATAVLLYFGGIFVLAKTAGDYFEYRSEQRMRKIRGEWYWNMNEHIVVINTPTHNGVQYFSRLIQQFRKSEEYGEHPIQILTTRFSDGLPEELSRLGNIVHYHGRADERDTLEAVNAKKADVVIVLAKDEHDSGSDSNTFAILHRLSDLAVEGTVLAECVEDRNRTRLSNAGADIVIRPIRAYPGMIVRGLVAPGSEQIVENLFGSEGDEYRRYDVKISELRWKEVVWRMVNNDLGTAVAYISNDGGDVYCNPPADSLVEASALIVMVREENIPGFERVEHALQARS